MLLYATIFRPHFQQDENIIKRRKMISKVLHTIIKLEDKGKKMSQKPHDNQHLSSSEIYKKRFCLKAELKCLSKKPVLFAGSHCLKPHRFC